VGSLDGWQVSLDVPGIAGDGGEGRYAEAFDTIGFVNKPSVGSRDGRRFRGRPEAGVELDLGVCEALEKLVDGVTMGTLKIPGLHEECSPQ